MNGDFLGETKVGTILFYVLFFFSILHVFFSCFVDLKLLMSCL